KELYERLKKEKLQVTVGLEQLKTGGQRGEERREGSPFGKREEEASEAFELEKRLALEQKLSATLTKISRAIEKYETGTYGLCDSCGRPIENERLEALPQASLCLNCKAQKAKNAKGAI
ncbi:MAG: TraR/DksA C4-type zinc finger protein, partial [Chloroflexota bacterium]|nr:TraR/DksA C4-type zinc finger protein [Chloroflexota bacterium]